MSNMHISVLLNEVIEILSPKSGDIFVDATFGAGGHSKIISEKVGSTGRVIGFEKDDRTYNSAREKFKAYPNVTIVNRGFEFLAEELENKIKEALMKEV